MDPIRPVDKLVKRSLDLLKGDFVVVGKRRVSLFSLSLVGMFIVGAIVAFGFLASRSGTLQWGSAASAPSCAGVRGLASTAESLGFVYVYADGIQNATDVKFAVWTDVGGQDDIVWYPGSSITGTASALVDLSKHTDEGTMNVHAYMFNGSSPTLCGGLTFTKPSGKSPVVYQLSKDFSSVDKQRGWNWKYNGLVYAPENTYTQCGSDVCWHGSGYKIIKKNIWATPEPDTSISVGTTNIRWQAPAVGSARITGTIRAVGGTCDGNGDGVYMEVIHKPREYGEATTIWSRLLVSGDEVGASFDKTVNFTGQVMYPGEHSLNARGEILFRLYPRGNNWCDWTEFDPKIEFTPTTPGGGKVTVKKVFLPGISASPTLLLDGVPPAGTQYDTAYWENVTPGERVLSVSGVPKVFYATCPGASECLSTPSEGTTISFNHQFGKSDTIRVYFGSATTELIDAYALASLASPLKADAYQGYNMSILANDCKVDLYTDATGDYLSWAEQSATAWLATGVKIHIISDVTKGSKVSLFCNDKTGQSDDISALRFGDFNLISCVNELAAGWTTYGPSLFDHTNLDKGYSAFYPDIAVDVADIGYSIDPVLYRNNITHVISHEIGHLLGLPHTVSNDSVMVAGSYNVIFPTITDIDAVKAKYPHCAPKPAKVSLSFSPSPATWRDRSGGTGKSSCRDGKMISPNSEWYSNLDIEETDGFSGATMNKAVVKQYDTSGVLRRTDTINNFYGGLEVKAGSIKAVSFYVTPRARFALGKITLKLFGMDDSGNTVETEERTLLLKTPPKGREKLAKCKNDSAEPWPILGGWFDPDEY